MTNDYTDGSAATNVSSVINFSEVVDYGDKAAHDYVTTVAMDYHDKTFMTAYMINEKVNKKDYQVCLKLRDNLTDFIDCMLKKARHNWEYLIGESNKFGRVGREIYKGHPKVHSVTHLDRTRIVALLEGCLDENIEYLDYQQFSDLDLRKYYQEQDPMLFINKVKRNLKEELIYPSNNRFPTGCFIINHGRYNPSFFEERYGGINEFFSKLLMWDTRHCYGIYISLLASENINSMGNSGPDLLDKAAIEWINEACDTNNVIYCRYPILEKATKLNDPDLEFQ